jgi:hypothetical protein
MLSYNEEMRRSGRINEAQKSLTDADVTELCSEAQKHWDRATRRTKKVKFTWHGRRYVSTLTIFRMLVQTAKGEPVCGRYHDW